MKVSRMEREWRARIKFNENQSCIFYLGDFKIFSALSIIIDYVGTIGITLNLQTNYRVF